MKIYPDNQLVKNLNELQKFGTICFGWTSLLEYLELGSLFSNLPSNDHLVKACISSLYTYRDKNDLFDVFDRLFAEYLSQIKDLPQIDPGSLLEAIKKDPILKPFLKNHASDTMHDLILYLSWDRMCICLANIFNEQSTDQKFIEGIDILKDCLIESFQHITEQGKTAPSYFRLVEALFSYYMREENLQKHSEEEWKILCQSLNCFGDQNELVDVAYIDNGLKREEEMHLTSDSSERVNSRIALAQMVMEKLKRDVKGWNYSLHPKKINHGLASFG